MKMFRKITAFAALLVASVPVMAAPILVDFEPRGAPTETGFSSVFATPTTISGVTFAFSGTLFDRTPGASDSGAFTYADLYNDFAYTNATGGATTAPAITLALTGLVADTSYDIRFFSSDFFSGAVGGPWAGSLQTTYTPTVGSGSAISSTFDRTLNPTSNLQNSVLGSFVSDGSGALTFSIQGAALDNGQAFTRLNGLEIARVPVPATLALLGLGLVGVGFSRKQIKEA